MIKEFQINIDDSQIELLHKKIELTRWPDEINNEYWSHGTSMSFLKDLSEYWINDFNWRTHEKELNDIGSYKFTSKTGLDIHFLHAKSNQKMHCLLL